MRLHRNAKTTPHMRALLVHRIGQEGWEPSEAAVPLLVPVDTRDWDALIPPDTPGTVRKLLDRLKLGG